MFMISGKRKMADKEKKKKSAETEENEVTLEQMLDEIDGIIEKLSDEDIPLEEAFAQYSKGVKLVGKCNESIDRVEKKVKMLLDNGDTEDFE